MFLNEYNNKIKLLCILFAYFYKDQKKIFLPIRLKMETRAGKVLSQPPPKEKTQSIKRKAIRKDHFIVGSSLEQLPTSQLPLRKQILQRYLFLREQHPKMKTSYIASCPPCVFPTTASHSAMLCSLKSLDVSGSSTALAVSGALVRWGWHGVHRASTSWSQFLPLSSGAGSVCP